MARDVVAALLLTPLVSASSTILVSTDALPFETADACCITSDC